MDKFIKPLPEVSISQEFYELIIKEIDGIKFVDDIGPYVNGYQDKLIKYCVASKSIILRGITINWLLNEYCKIREELPEWKQYICRINSEQEEPFVHTFSPLKCRFIVMNELHKAGLDDKKIDERLHEYEEDYDEELKQRHEIICSKNIIYKFDNCVYYDINKAHSDALSEIFPEIKDWLCDIAKLAKTDKRWKSVPNFYVGMLAMKTSKMRKNDVEGRYEKTYNWIVHRTTKILNKRINEVSSYKSDIVYANTDGVVIYNPSKIIPSSSEFGDFKLETDIKEFYTYQSDNYSIIQYGDTIKGNLPLALRNRVDLRKGKVISFDKVKRDGYYEFVNIKEHTLEVNLWR